MAAEDEVLEELVAEVQEQRTKNLELCCVLESLSATPT